MKPLMLKFLALIVGTNLWYIFSQSRHDTITIDVPVAFYNTEILVTIEAPETIRVALAGQRSDLAAIDLRDLTIHLDASKLSTQSSKLPIDSQHMFLPTTIKMIHYSPAPMPVHVTLQSNQL